MATEWRRIEPRKMSSSTENRETEREKEEEKDEKEENKINEYIEMMKERIELK